MARYYTSSVDNIYHNQGMPGVFKLLRSARPQICAEILRWALDTQKLDVARQAYGKVSADTKWTMVQYLADHRNYHRAFPMVLGGQDPSRNNAELLWLAAVRQNRETVRYLVRHPKITAEMCVGKNKNAAAQHLVTEELALWQREHLLASVGPQSAPAVVRKM